MATVAPKTPKTSVCISRHIPTAQKYGKIANRLPCETDENIAHTLEEKMVYEKQNESLKSITTRIHRVICPLLQVMGIPEIKANRLPSEIRSCRSHRSSQENSPYRPNRVKNISNKLRELQDNLFTLRRNFLLEEAQASSNDDNMDTAYASTDDTSTGRKNTNNVILELILKQVTTSSGLQSPSALMRSSSRIANEEGMKRAEAYEKVFNQTLDRVLEDYRDFCKCKKRAEKAPKETYSSDENEESDMDDAYEYLSVPESPPRPIHGQLRTRQIQNANRHIQLITSRQCEFDELQAMLGF